MIKMIRKIFCWIHENEESQLNRNSRESLDELYSLLVNEFFVVTLDDLLKRRNIKMGGSSEHRIEIENMNKERDAIKILKNTFNATVYREWEGIQEIWLNIDFSKVRKQKQMSQECPIHNFILPELTRTLDFLDKNETRGFTILLDKYDSIFYSQYQTIKDLKETDTLDDEAKQKIVNVIQTFIDEFNSLEALYNKQIELDRQAVRDSLKRRLDEDLELVNMIKTNWNAEFQKEEVKIEI